jgi:hypothetical protein
MWNTTSSGPDTTSVPQKDRLLGRVPDIARRWYVADGDREPVISVSSSVQWAEGNE